MSEQEAVTSTTSEGSEMPPPASTEPILTKEQKIAMEKQQEEKLRSKYPQVGGRPMPGGGVIGGGAGGGGHSAFLQKRLAKGQKYFDSGDYQMAKQKSKGPNARPGAVGAAGNRLIMPVLAQPPTGDTIPTPELVPQRKTSIIQPLHDHSQSMHLISDPAHNIPGSSLGGGGSPGASSAGPGPLVNPALGRLAS